MRKMRLAEPNMKTLVLVFTGMMSAFLDENYQGYQTTKKAWLMGRQKTYCRWIRSSVALSSSVWHLKEKGNNQLQT
jgi:hypothetical protein